MAINVDGGTLVINLGYKGESEFSKNKNDRRWPARDFHKVSLRNKTVYMYHHKQHVAFSSTHFSQLRRCGIVGDVSQPMFLNHIRYQLVQNTIIMTTCNPSS